MSDSARRSDLLSTQQHRAIDALIEGATIRNAAKAAEVDERTIYRWLNAPEFTSELRRLRDGASALTATRASMRSELMLMTLESVALDRRAKHRDRADAAKKHLDVLLRLRELEREDASKTGQKSGARRIVFTLDPGPREPAADVPPADPDTGDSGDGG